MDVTPEMAREWLKKNANNRTVRPNRVKLYSELMKNGQWDLTGQGISITADGTLIDGQHRLFAILRSQCTVKMLVVFDAQKSYGYDCGAVRSVSDRISMHSGTHYSNNKISAAKLALELYFGATIPKANDIADFITEHEKSLDIAEKYARYNKSTTCKCTRSAPVMLSLVLAYENGISEYTIKYWCQEVQTGIQESSSKSAILYRNRELLKEFSGREL